MSIMAPHAKDRDIGHACGGTIHTATTGTERYDHCDRCGAYAFGGESVPDGTDENANRSAWDAGEDCSPDAAQ